MLKQQKENYAETPFAWWMNSFPSFYLLLFTTHFGNSPSQYHSDFPEPYVQTKFKKSTSCQQQAGLLLKPKTAQNKWSHSQASACLTQSFRAVFFQHEPWTELFSSLMLLLNEMLFIQNICLLFQRIFVLNTWFSLCLYLIYQEPCHLRFSFQWHKTVLFMHRVGYFF